MSDIQCALDNITQEFKLITDDRDYYQHKVESLEDELDDKEKELDGKDDYNDEPLHTISTKLGVIVIPGMTKWALLLNMERAIEKIRKLKKEK